MDWKFVIAATKVGSVIVFLVSSVSISFNLVSGIALAVLISVIFGRKLFTTPDGEHSISSTEENPLKKKRTILTEGENLKIKHEVYEKLTYEAETVDSLFAFQTIQDNSQCNFAKRAKLWGSQPWQEKLSLEENVWHCLPTFLKFCLVCQTQPLDGFVFELPGDTYGENIESFGEAVRRVLTVLSNGDPAKVHCMNKSYVGKKGWVFEFDQVTMFVTTFAPFYKESHCRYAFDAKNCYILFQPELSFARHDLTPDTTHTNWEKPVTVRDKIRVAFKAAGRGYHIRDTLYYPMAHDVVKSCDEEAFVEWWIKKDKKT